MNQAASMASSVGVMHALRTGNPIVDMLIAMSVPVLFKFAMDAVGRSDWWEMINALLSTVDPDTGEPYICLKAGRPDWDAEFTQVSETYGREDVGVVFCGAPMIAAALKEACEKHSATAKTVFRLHKENF